MLKKDKFLTNNEKYWNNLKKGIRQLDKLSVDLQLLKIDVKSKRWFINLIEIWIPKAEEYYINCKCDNFNINNANLIWIKIEYKSFLSKVEKFIKFFIKSILKLEQINFYRAIKELDMVVLIYKILFGETWVEQMKNIGENLHRSRQNYNKNKYDKNKIDDNIYIEGYKYYALNDSILEYVSNFIWCVVFPLLTTLLNIVKNYNTKSEEKINIGIFSSSSDLGYKYQDRVLKAKKILEENGFNITLGSLWNKSIGYTTGTPKQRAKEINDLAKNNKILMSMIGGYNSSSILKYINYDLIKENKIKVMGFSDTTAILLAIYNKTKLPVYYGPVLLPSINEQEYIKNWNINQIKDFVIGNKKNIINPDFWTDERIDWSKYDNETRKKLYPNKLESINKGIVEGRLIGGNLNTIVSIYNTEFMPKIKQGDILFIEDSLKTIDECERNFAFLKNSKILDKISGVIIGKIEGFDKKESNETYESLFLKFLNRKIPVLMKFDCSHCHPMNILKIGSKIKLNTFNNTVEYI